jgi:hypothetical protein
MELDGNVRIEIEEKAAYFRRMAEHARRAALARAVALAPGQAFAAEAEAEESERAVNESAAMAFDDAAEALDDVLAGKLTPTALRARALTQLSILDQTPSPVPLERACAEARRRPLEELANFLLTIAPE